MDRLWTGKVTDRQTSDKGMATTNPAYFREQATINQSTGRGRDSRERERDRKREEFRETERGQAIPQSLKELELPWLPR